MVSLSGSLRERDDDAIDAVLVHERPQIVELTERCDATRFRPALERLGVDETDQIQPVLGVLPDLPGDELADLARSDARACAWHTRSIAA